MDHVVGGAAGVAGAPAGEPGLDDVVADLQGEDGVEVDAVALQGLGLGDGAGHPVQNEAAGTVGLGQRSWMMPMMTSSGTSLPASI